MYECMYRRIMVSHLTGKPSKPYGISTIAILSKEHDHNEHEHNKHIQGTIMNHSVVTYIRGVPGV